MPANIKMRAASIIILFTVLFSTACKKQSGTVETYVPIVPPVVEVPMPGIESSILNTAHLEKLAVPVDGSPKFHNHSVSMPVPL